MQHKFKIGKRESHELIEFWKDIEGFDNCEISSIGRIKIKGIIQKLFPAQNGYLMQRTGY